ncbi:hypothetical protein ABVN64_29970 [Mycolicibacterium conceptionense]
MIRALRAVAVGIATGLGIFALFAWAFGKGCPIFDPILERDTTQPF